MAICESCGRDERDTTTVQRMYLVTDPEGEGGRTGPSSDDAPTAGDIEHWCASCCATFPHVVVREV